MRSKFLVLALALSSILVYGGCNSKQQDATKDAAQNAAQQAQTAAGNAADATKDAAGKAMDATKDAATKTADAAKNSAAKASDAVKEAVAPKPIVIPSGTTLTVRLGETVSAKTATPGQSFNGSLSRAVSVDGTEAIASGASVTGEVTDAKSLSKFKGEGRLAIRLTSIDIKGKTYPLSTSTVAQVVKGKGKRNLMIGGGGAALGALIGGLAGGGKGAGIGALAGGGAGTAGAAYTGNKDVAFPAETALSFKLKDSITLK